MAAPHLVCDDWFYRAVARLPGPGIVWAGALGAALPVTTHALLVSGAPIEHVRSATEIAAPYFSIPVLLVLVAAMPLLYASGVACFDRLSPSMTTSDEEPAANRRRLIQPSVRTQFSILAVSLLASAIAQENSSARITRFTSGDWNAVDLWLTFAAALTLTSFIWFLGIPLTWVASAIVELIIERLATS